jgi:DNA (cytosine-5)-methyltransferase 1
MTATVPRQRRTTRHIRPRPPREFLAPRAGIALRPDEIIVDNFAGGGGASQGIEQALGRPIDIAINHDPEAISMHAVWLYEQSFRRGNAGSEPRDQPHAALGSATKY